MAKKIRQIRNEENTVNETNVTDEVAAAAVATEPTAEPAADQNRATFLRKSVAPSGKTASYRIPGIAAVIKVSRALVADGQEFPEQFEVTGFPFATPRVKQKLTPEEIAARRAERKARLASMTPAERLALQEARLKKQQENLRKRREQLGLLD